MRDIDPAISPSAHNASPAEAERRLAPMLFKAISSWPGGLDGVCFVSADRTLTARQVLAQVSGRAELLRQQQVAEQDVILLVTGRGQRFWLDQMAIWAIGAIAVPIEPNPVPSRLATVVQKAAPAWRLGTLGEAAGNTIRSLLDCGEDEFADSDIAFPYHEFVTDPEAIATILFTSGTTGEPKGVALSHRALAGNASATSRRLRLCPTDTLGAAIPFRFVSALSHFLVCILAGARYAGTETGLAPHAFINFILESGCTAYGGSPLQLRWIAEWLESQPLDGVDSRLRIRWLMSSGDFFFEEIRRRILRYISECCLIVAYGLTEAAGRMCCRVTIGLSEPDDGDQACDGFVGQPIDGLRLQAFDDGHNRCKPGEAGRIFAQGRYLFSGYVNDAGRTSEVLRDGWLDTGDYGYQTRSGEIRLLGRSDEIFKVDGVKVSTTSIARTLLAVDRFTDVAVTQEPHPTIGTVPYAHVVLAPGQVFDLRETMQFLRQRLPTSHLPWKFMVIDRIPRTGSGKVDRRALRASTLSRK